MKEFAVLLVLCCFSAAAHNSIMDLINSRQVEQVLLERNLNHSSKALPSQDPNADLNGEDDLFDENDIPDINTNSIAEKQHGRKSKSTIPEFAAVLSGMYRSDKLLKSDPSGLIVTKKDYLRKDWCRTAAIIQKIREEGCLPKTVVNRFCYGQCNSFFIPKNVLSRRGKKRRGQDYDESQAFRSCGVCKPKKSVWSHVTLHCPGLNPPVRRRRVFKVKQCQCIAENSN